MLSTQKDLFNQPRIKLDWQTSDIDKKTIQRALDVLALECGKQHFGRARLAKDIQKFGISSHHMGATRMSHSPSDGVVNENCRVHGIDNLFIASSSVFSTGGWANATLTITALSIRLADHLKSLLS
jgi:choline dehydrogenase-like flavoprotein